MKSPRLRLLLIIATLLGLAGWFGWASRYNPDYSFLPGNAAAPWRIYPAPPDTEMHNAVPLTAIYRGEFAATEANASLLLKLRAFRNASIELNGLFVTNWTRANNWKQEVAIDLAGRWRLGTNVLSITVTNDSGPPALCAYLENQTASASSFEPAWQVSLAGAAWQPAAAIRMGDAMGQRVA